MEESDVSVERLRKSIIDMAVESWRFRRIFEKAMTKLDAGDSSRYVNHFSWFTKKVDAVLENAGLRIVNVEGQFFDIGMAVTPLNLDDFDVHDRLIVEQMVEPIIMEAGSVIKTGTVTLGRVDR